MNNSTIHFTIDNLYYDFPNFHLYMYKRMIHAFEHIFFILMKNIFIIGMKINIVLA